MRPVVANRVGLAWPVSVSITLLSPAKTAELIDLQFALRTREGTLAPPGEYD